MIKSASVQVSDCTNECMYACIAVCVCVCVGGWVGVCKRMYMCVHMNDIMVSILYIMKLILY